ncbi:MAG: paraquat-inducible protein A [Janthinobacterium lividum]
MSEQHVDLPGDPHSAQHAHDDGASEAAITARDHGLVGCDACGLIAQRVKTIDVQHCLRCAAPLHSRKPDSAARVWALLISAVLLYIPANLLPVMHTATLLGASDDTIMSGVVYFWTSGSYGLAIIVFVASILVPMLKLVILSLLNFTVQRRSTWRPEQRTRLYHIVEAIGRWSMLDIFVITLTISLVRFQSLAVITSGPGAVAFGCVVVLTMLASLQFDPRRIWDPIDDSGLPLK